MASQRLKADFSVAEIENAAMLLRRALSSAELDNLVPESEAIQGVDQLDKIEKMLVHAISNS
jgi:hypothetical protein